ncbi:allophanate hydrolase [Prauserella marina]|uniref:Sensor histidine kinase inhibitor, KipI family n=1 Tax=Prauserella marina TaxID=530584 RepID=A0A222VZ05_9PSEU|nr:allophanate hydrolase subunit 1 [Prauserella marina]ASR38941.1 allophanate hydrolase [Prauserella marina]PWV71939.1 KipI family sensor histidine kinase inhibitor [Prauserella marina]SDD91430.1 sensor histidine kinase inhibitor, KipI family [Prauserella marina]
MRVLPCADLGLLVELDDLDAVRALHAALAANLPPGVTDLVPAARTLLLRLDPRTANPSEIEQFVRATRPVAVGEQNSELVRIPVVYDGEDLDDVAKLTGLTRQEVIIEHTETEWRVAFGGFAPGFGYLTGDSAKLEVPRRKESRTKVPVGAVALAGAFTGVYPRESPGGWQLIGRTDLLMWQVDRDPPALLRPGVRVRFEEVR